MWALFIGFTFGLLASARSETAEVKSRSCSYVGVFQVEGQDRYVLSYNDATDLCLKLGSTLATEEAVRHAYNNKMETCRYGWTANMTIAILRHTAHEKCYLNQTGFGVNQGNSTMLSDAYCYNETDFSERNCDNAINPLSTKSDSEAVATSGETTDSPGTATDVNELEPGLLTVAGDLVTVAAGEPDNTTLDTNDTKEATFITNLSTEVMNERGFQTTPVALDEDQRTSPTEVTGVRMPDDTTGSGIMPTTEEIQETHIPVVKETPKPVAEVTPERPEYKAESNTVFAPEGRKVLEPAHTEEQKKEGSDWLVILLVIVAIAAIVLVIAAIVTRKRWCGKHQTLNISKSGGEGNGAAAAVVGSRAEEREQEMVTLMNKEKIQENGNTEEFTAITVEGSSEKA